MSANQDNNILNKNPHILIVTGETSGDQRAAELVGEIKKILPNAQFSALGGNALEECGCRKIGDIGHISATGFFEVLGKLFSIFKLLDKIKTFLRCSKPHLTILVDAPDFNFRLLKYAALFSRLVYYISPQIWAWRPNRAKTLGKYCQKVITLFPFEKKFYLNKGVNREKIEWVGHPLALDHLQERKTKDNGALKKILLLPGSRDNEVKRLLPPMVNACQLINNEIGETNFTLLKARGVNPALFDHSLTGNKNLGIEIIEQGEVDSRQVIQASYLVIAASGTATLEVALAGIPMVVVYRLFPLSYWLACLLVKTPHIAMPNLILGERVVPELIQGQATAANIFFLAKKFIQDRKLYQKTANKLFTINQMLYSGQPAATKAAQIIKKLMKEH